MIKATTLVLFDSVQCPESIVGKQVQAARLFTIITGDMVCGVLCHSATEAVPRKRDLTPRPVFLQVAVDLQPDFIPLTPTKISDIVERVGKIITPANSDHDLAI